MAEVIHSAEDKVVKAASVAYRHSRLEAFLGQGGEGGERGL